MDNGVPGLERKAQAQEPIGEMAPANDPAFLFGSPFARNKQRDPPAGTKVSERIEQMSASINSR